MGVSLLRVVEVVVQFDFELEAGHWRTDHVNQNTCSGEFALMNIYSEVCSLICRLSEFKQMNFLRHFVSLFKIRKS